MIFCKLTYVQQTYPLFLRIKVKTAASAYAFNLLQQLITRTSSKNVHGHTKTRTPSTLVSTD